jgi:hypothetical protein
MCIFNENAYIGGTKIMAGETVNGNHFFAYQNSVKSETKNVMMLPIPASTDKVKLHDTSGFADFCNIAAKEIYRKWSETRPTLRGGLQIEKGYKKVGQYRYKIVDDFIVERELILLGLDVKHWLPQILKKYKDWKFLFCIMEAGTTMESQPLFLEYTPMFPDKFYFPMMDVHGDEKLAERVKRDHIIGVCTQKQMDKNQYKIQGLPTDFHAHDWYWTGAVTDDYTKNGDYFIKIDKSNYDDAFTAKFE